MGSIPLPFPLNLLLSLVPFMFTAVNLLPFYLSFCLVKKKQKKKKTPQQFLDSTGQVKLDCIQAVLYHLSRQKECSPMCRRRRIQPPNQRGKCVTVARGRGHGAIIWNSRAFLESLHRKPWTFCESRGLEEETETKDGEREKEKKKGLRELRTERGMTLIFPNTVTQI